MRTFLIGVGHKARHGKDYLSKILHAQSPLETKIFSFAADLKGYCRVAHGMRHKDAPLLQRVGSELRKENPDVFVECVEQQIVEENPHVAIIPDMRYPNEFDWVKNHGGITIKVVRQNPDGSLYIDPSRPSDHPSETALDNHKFDYVVLAESGNLIALENAAKSIWADVIQKLK